MSQSINETIRQSEKIRLDLIKTELDVAFTFAQVAFQSGDSPEKRRRNTSNARKAYDTLLKLAAQAAQDETAAQKLRHDLNALRQQLISLGEADLGGS